MISVALTNYTNPADVFVGNSLTFDYQINIKTI